MNKLITLSLLLIGMSMGGLITYYNTTQLDNLFRKPETNSKQELINHYNMGYRSGAMNTLAEMVECYGVEDETVLQYYYTASDSLEKLGELDEAPYPCEE